jgi:hypothetical protein
MNMTGLLRLAGITLGGLVLLMTPRQVFAQSCALCYTQAASSGARMIAALRSGIVILVLPPILLSIGVAVLAYRRRYQFRNTDMTESDESRRSRILQYETPWPPLT